MPEFAVLENNIVINTIVCESKELAEQLLGKTCVPCNIQSTNPDEVAVVGVEWDGNKFIHPPQEIVNNPHVEPDDPTKPDAYGIK